MRIPKPFFRKQTKCWYVQLGRRQINLGKDQATASEKYHQIMAGQQAPMPDMPVDVLLDRFLEWCLQNRAAASYQWYRKYLKPFVDSIGNLSVADLRPYHVTTWIANYPTDGNRNCGVRAVKRAFKWAVDEGYLSRSPVATCKRPNLYPREVYVSPEQWRQFIGLIKPGPFRNAVLFLRLTGCRPQEMIVIEARHIEDGCVVLDRIKSKGKRNRRVIPLTERALELIRPLMKEHPTGPIFRTATGKPWTSHSLNTRFDHYEQKLGFKIFPYVIRHSFITDALEKGMDPVKLAEIVGHKDLKMIHSVYSHLNLKREHLREAIAKIEVDPNLWTDFGDQ